MSINYLIIGLIILLVILVIILVIKRCGKSSSKFTSLPIDGVIQAFKSDLIHINESPKDIHTMKKIESNRSSLSTLASENPSNSSIMELVNEYSKL